MSDIGNPFKTLPNAWAQAVFEGGNLIPNSQIGKAAKIVRTIGGGLPTIGLYIVVCDLGGYQEPDATHLTTSYEMTVRIASATPIIWVLDPVNSTNTLKEITLFDAAGAPVDLTGNMIVSIRRLAV